MADALEQEGELGVQRPSPRVVGGTKSRSREVGNCQVFKSAKVSSVLCLRCGGWEKKHIPVKFVRTLPKVLKTPPQPSKISEDSETSLVAVDLMK